MLRFPALAGHQQLTDKEILFLRLPALGRDRHPARHAAATRASSRRDVADVIRRGALGALCATLFRLPDTEAGFMATVQQFGLSAIVEALIVLSAVAFELMGRNVPAKSTGPASVHTKLDSLDISPTRPPAPRSGS